MTPFVAILSNLSTRTVVAYCIAFESADEGGRSRQNLVHFNYPNAVAGTAPDQTGLPRGREVRPGEERVVGLRFEINPSVDNAWLDEFAKQQGDLAKGLRSLTVEVDAAIFDDGVLVGRDTSGLQQAFEMYLQATQGLYHQSCESSTQVRLSTPSSLRSERLCGRIEKRASTIQTIVRRCTPFRRPAMLFRRGRVLETTK